jgi:hypothetical protein
MISNKLKVTTLASAIAAAASMPALSNLDVDAANHASVKYASEAKVLGTIPASGLVAVEDGGIGTITGSVDVASTAVGLTKFLRYDLSNGATFKGNPTLASGTHTDCGTSLAGGLESGGDGESFATFRNAHANDKTQLATCDWVMTLSTTAGDGLNVDPTAVTSLTYSMYDTLGQSVSLANALTSKTVPIVEFVAGSVPTAIIEASNTTATVASDFQKFTNAAPIGVAANTAVTSLALIDVTDIVSTTQATKDLAGNVADKDDFLTAAQSITITGDVSQGTFFSDTAAACDETAAIACTANAAKTACTITATAANADFTICADFSGLATGVKVNKSAYSIAFGTETAVTGSLGSIAYDTISLEIPYITTFEGYNQRIFIDNRGTTDASYSTTFTTESGVTAAAGTAGSGTLAAGAISVVKVSDLVTFTGGSRGTATMELEANGDNLKVTTQIVDLGTGMTDTILLHPSTQQ